MTRSRPVFFPKPKNPRIKRPSPGTPGVHGVIRPSSVRPNVLFPPCHFPIIEPSHPSMPPPPTNLPPYDQRPNPLFVARIPSHLSRHSSPRQSTLPTCTFNLIIVVVLVPSPHCSGTVSLTAQVSRSLDSPLHPDSSALQHHFESLGFFSSLVALQQFQ